MYFRRPTLVNRYSVFHTDIEPLGFRTILIYNFSFSLVLSGPVALVTTRYVADAIFTRS